MTYVWLNFFFSILKAKQQFYGIKYVITPYIDVHGTGGTIIMHSSSIVLECLLLKQLEVG